MPYWMLDVFYSQVLVPGERSDLAHDMFGVIFQLKALWGV